MFCHKCGKELLKDAKFCSYCGSKTSQVEQKINQNGVVDKINTQEIFKNRNIYIFLFIVLILPAIINKILYYNGYQILSVETSQILTIFTKISFIILTFWYSLKLKINSLAGLLLGLSTLIPFIAWVSLIILLVETNNIVRGKNKKFQNYQKIKESVRTLNPEEEKIKKEKYNLSMKRMNNTIYLSLISIPAFVFFIFIFVYFSIWLLLVNIFIISLIIFLYNQRSKINKQLKELIKNQH